MTAARTAWSTTDARHAFAGVTATSLDRLVGRHRSEFVGDAWWRQTAPRVVALAGMPGWWGKQFASSPSDPAVLEGHNLVERDGRLVSSYPMRARLAPSRTDGLPALVVTYPPPAPWQWRQVTDELRPLDDGTLVGLTFTSVPAFPGGLPFVLHRHAR